MNIRRVYETTIIINAALEDHDIDVIINKITTLLENHGGVIEETNKWGRRRLAYTINKKHNGYYVHLVFEAAPSVIPMLERFLVLEDTILRHLTLQLEAELRAYRKEKSLAAGKSGETTMLSIVEVERDLSPVSSGRFFNKFNRTVAPPVIAVAESVEDVISADEIDIVINETVTQSDVSVETNDEV